MHVAVLPSINGSRECLSWRRHSSVGMEVGSPQLSAVIWHQGESDAEDPEYLKKLSVVVNEIRSKVGQPDLLFIAGEVYGDRPVNDKITVAIGEHIHSHRICFSQGLNGIR